ncbi:MAG: hypothetical protein KGY80_11935 [Candidatus Thorarchaeota archaeon]|nr:hypothetical protein [Candidatus Thorarchaeota archaeon]
MFKNKDLLNKNHVDNLVFNNQMFAVSGVVIGSGERAGVSIGINKHGLAGCSATVLPTEDRPYDHLLENIIQVADDIDSAYQIVEDKISSGIAYQWCNLVLGDSRSVAAIEISNNQCKLERSDDYVVRTNHHVLLNTIDDLKAARAEKRGASGPVWKSRRRRQKAERELAAARTVVDVTEILSSHSEGKGFDSICRHSDGGNLGRSFLGQTAYSYVFDVLYADASVPGVTFHVAPGNPCVTTYKRLNIDFSSSKEERKKLTQKYPK